MARRIGPIALVTPTVVILLAIVVYPMIFSLNVSFRAYDLRRPLEEHPFIGFGNYAKMFTDTRFYNSVINACYLVVGMVSLQFLIGFGLALLLSREFRGKRVLLPLFFLPMMVTPIVVGYMGRLIFEPRSGPMNYILNVLGMSSLGWHTKLDTALLTIILLDTWQWTPFTLMVLLAGLLSLPQEPFESAKVDGASRWQIFRYLTLPLMKPVIAIVILMRTLDVLKMFDTIYMLTYGGPGVATETLYFYTFFIGFRYWDVGYASAASWFLSIILSIGFTIFLRVIKE